MGEEFEDVTKDVVQHVIAVADPSVVLVWLKTTGLNVGLRVLAAAAIFAGGLLAIKLLKKVLHAALAKFGTDRAMVATFIVSVVEKAAWAFLAVVVLGKLGVDVGPLIAGLGVTGFVLGFAFQESLGSLASGLMIAFNRPFKVGDYVSVAGFEGSVTKLDMMAVILATADNRQITIPNKSAWGSPIVNYSALELRRVDLVVGVAYGCDLAKAKATALEAIKSVPGVLADPAPLAEVKSLDDSAVTLTVRGWTKNADYWNVFFAGNQIVKEALDRAGVGIPFPQLEVHMVKD